MMGSLLIVVCSVADVMIHSEATAPPAFARIPWRLSAGAGQRCRISKKPREGTHFVIQLRPMVAPSRPNDVFPIVLNLKSLIISLILSVASQHKLAKLTAKASWNIPIARAIRIDR
jgi:hypothetical protein